MNQQSTGYTDQWSDRRSSHEKPNMVITMNENQDQLLLEKISEVNKIVLKDYPTYAIKVNSDDSKKDMGKGTGVMAYIITVVYEGKEVKSFSRKIAIYRTRTKEHMVTMIINGTTMKPLFINTNNAAIESIGKYLETILRKELSFVERTIVKVQNPATSVH